MKVFRGAALLAATVSIAAMTTQGASAQDVDAALERFKALMADQSLALDWENAEISGDSAVLTGVTAGTEDGSVPVGDLTVTGVAETDIGYTIDSVVMESYLLEAEGNRVSVEDVELTGLILADDDADSPLAGLLFYETATMGTLSVAAKGTEVFSMSDLELTVTEPSDTAPMDFTGTSGGFAVDLSTVEDPRARQTIEALGYETLEGNFAMAGTWNPTDGQLALTQNDIMLDEVGTLGITIDLGGYTPEFAKALSEMQRQMAESGGASDEAQGMAMLGLMQQLSLNGVEITFEDDSVTGRALEFAAAQQGVTADNLANQLKGMLPFVLGQLNAPELTMQATQAISAFLDDPQNLRIAAEPAQPVPFALIAAGAMSSPQALIGQLGVVVEANQ